jgi:hypothetical protein
MDEQLRATLLRCVACVALLALAAGCTRTHYRIKADRDAYSIANEKSIHTPWELPWDYNLLPPEHSRLYDPTPIDDPLLPLPAPQLYAYDLPPLRDAQSQQFQPGGPNLPHSSRRGHHSGLVQMFERLPAIENPPDLANKIKLVRFDEKLLSTRAVRRAVLQPPEQGGQLTPPIAGEDTETQPADQTIAQYGDEVTVSPIPVEFWEVIPRSCLVRMLEFESVREEYERTRKSYGQQHEMPPPEEYADRSPRLTLKDIMDLTQLNSREYQSEKEILYRFALALSLQRFDYHLKPSTSSNGTAVNYDHTRVLGITTNTLRVPTALQADRMLATGGDILARFANSVVLTFNGPTGFAADIGSDLIFDISQNVLQRDIRLEGLTQAERSVLYAVRDFTRFRKNLFRQQSASYYNLLNTYRNIEIESQNYFAFIRSFDERDVEYRYGLTSRYQVDQLEQSVLTGRSRLISTCNALEGALDNLKINMGLPTETPLNLNLTELEQLTLRDELAVTGEGIRRVRRRLLSERQSAQPSTVLLLSYAIVISDRILEAYDLRARIDGQPLDAAELLLLGAQLRVDAGRLIVEQQQAELDEQLGSVNPDPAATFLRSMRLAEELLRLTVRQIDLAERLGVDPQQLEQLRLRLDELGQRAAAQDNEFSTLLEEGTILAQLPEMVQRAATIRKDSRQLSLDADRALGVPPQPPTPEELLAQLNEQLDLLLQQADSLLSDIGSGLVPVEIELDDAMMTALVLRFDLMTQRGFLADDWRAIKFAGDDLKSILNLRATQRISTPPDHNRPFAFSFEDSQTSLDLTFDAPFNRRAQRNAFRQSLINYQSSLRRLMQLEDTVKLSVRSDLRNLSLGKETYAIAVASAALTSESVVSNDLQLQLGLAGVSARDFRESRIAYTNALIAVANNHIDYINDRTQLFFDLELLTVGDDGFWQELNDDDYQPTPYYQLPHHALPGYGHLPRRVHHSHRIKRMNHIPPGISAVHGERRSADLNHYFSESEELPLPANAPE